MKPIDFYRKLRRLTRTPEGAPAPSWTISLFHFFHSSTEPLMLYVPSTDTYTVEGITFTGQWLRDHRDELSSK